MSEGIYYIGDDQPARPQPRRGWNIFGLLGLLTSILGIFTLGLASPFGLLLSLIGLTGRPRGAAKVGVFLGGLGTAVLALFGYMIFAGASALDNNAKSAHTQNALQEATARIVQFHVEEGKLPEGIEGNKLFIANDYRDAWGTELRYEPAEDNTFQVRSAGPDRQFDTRDDLLEPK